MKFNSRIASAVAIMAMAVACQADPVSPADPSGKRDAVEFSAGRTASFPSGTKIGLFVSEPISEDNVLLTIGEDGAITPEKEIFWGKEQTEPSVFFAYSPYDPSYSSAGTQVFSIPLNQSIESEFNAAKLAAGTTKAAPSDNGVDIVLNHKTSLIQLFFQNNSGATISKVKVTGVKHQIQFSISTSSQDDVAAVGEVADITTYKFDSGKQVSYNAIIAPQTAKLGITVLLSDGRTVSATIPEAQQFEPGKVYSTSDLPIAINGDSIILNFTISDWEDGGQLDFSGDDPSGDFTPLADLAATATATKSTFSVTVKDVTVTSVYNSYAYIQDKSGAILVYSSTHGLAEGNTINGAISGSVVLYDGNKTYVGPGYAEITELNLSNAAVGNTTEIPYVTLSLAELLADYEKYYSCRVLLKGVTVTKGVNSSVNTGSVRQGTDEITLFSKNTAGVNIGDGAQGDLYSFPTIYKGAKQLQIFYQNQFEEKTEPAEDNAFTRLETPGAYNISDINAPSALILEDLSAQTSVYSGSSVLKLRLIRPLSGQMVSLSFGTSSFATGRSYAADVITFGTIAVTPGSSTLKCVKTDSGRVWFKDETNKIGYVFSTK